MAKNYWNKGIMRKKNTNKTENFRGKLNRKFFSQKVPTIQLFCEIKNSIFEYKLLKSIWRANWGVSELLGLLIYYSMRCLAFSNEKLSEVINEFKYSQWTI